MSGQSEEKNLPASQHKLKKAREKGQVVTSREALASVGTAFVLLYLFMRRDAIGADLVAIFVLDPDPAAIFAEQLAAKVRIILRLVTMIVLPVLIGTIVIAVLGGMVVSGGPVFSTHPLIPGFTKLNPASGVKKIVGRRALLSFLMHVLRIAALLTVPGLILWRHIFALTMAPPCGMACMGQAIWGMVLAVLVGILTILVIATLFDYLVQRAAFLHEQRMSITEFKREIKDQEGDPMLKSQQRADQRAMVERPTGLGQATAIIHAAPDLAIGLRYVEDDTPAPLVVVRARGAESVSRLLSVARVRVSYDPAATAMIAAIPVGEYVVEDEQIQAIAPYLRNV